MRRLLRNKKGNGEKMTSVSLFITLYFLKKIFLQSGVFPNDRCFQVIIFMKIKNNFSSWTIIPNNFTLVSFAKINWLFDASSWAKAPGCKIHPKAIIACSLTSKSPSKGYSYSKLTKNQNFCFLLLRKKIFY